MATGGVLLHRRQHVEQPHRVGIKHRAAAKQRKTVAAQVDHVDVGGTQRDAFFQNARAFIDHGIHQPLNDLLVSDAAPLNADVGRMLDDHRVDRLARNRLALARLVVVPAGARLLTETAHLAQQVGGFGIHDVGFIKVAPLADVPADVVASQIPHAERPHRTAKLLDGLVNLLGQATLFQQKAGLAAVLLDDPVANKTVAHARHHADFFQFF